MIYYSLHVYFCCVSSNIKKQNLNSIWTKPEQFLFSQGNPNVSAFFIEDIKLVHFYN